MAIKLGCKSNGITGVVAFAGVYDNALEVTGRELRFFLQGFPKVCNHLVHQHVGADDSLRKEFLLCVSDNLAGVNIHGVLILTLKIWKNKENYCPLSSL